MEKAITESMVEVGTGLEYRITVLEGKPAAEIAGLTVGRRDTIVVIASRGAGGLERMMLGSTADRVVRLASCPVLIVKAENKGIVE